MSKLQTAGEPSAPQSSSLDAKGRTGRPMLGIPATQEAPDKGNRDSVDWFQEPATRFIWDLELGACLGFGAWSLGFRTTAHKRTAAVNFHHHSRS